jgi:hypothetical protein
MPEPLNQVASRFSQVAREAEGSRASKVKLRRPGESTHHRQR